MATEKKAAVFLPSEEREMRNTALAHACDVSAHLSAEGITNTAAEFLRFLRTGKKPAKKKPVQHTPLQLVDNGDAE